MNQLLGIVQLRSVHDNHNETVFRETAAPVERKLKICLWIILNNWGIYFVRAHTLL